MAPVLAFALLWVVFTGVVHLLLALPIAAAAESLSAERSPVAARFWAAACFVPAIVGGVLAPAAVVLPSTGAITPHLERIRPHICWHPLIGSPDAGWHFRLAAGIALGIIATALVRFTWRAVRTWRLQNRAKVLGSGESAVLRSDSSGTFCFTIGFSRGVIIVSDELVDDLDEEARTALVTHEHQHLRRRDNLQHLLLEMAATLALPVPLGYVYFNRWRAAAETACDEAAAEKTSAEVVKRLLDHLAELKMEHHARISGGTVRPVYRSGLAPRQRISRLVGTRSPAVAPPLKTILALEGLLVVVAVWFLCQRIVDSLYCAGSSVLSVLSGG